MRFTQAYRSSSGIPLDPEGHQLRIHRTRHATSTPGLREDCGTLPLPSPSPTRERQRNSSRYTKSGNDTSFSSGR